MNHQFNLLRNVERDMPAINMTPPRVTRWRWMTSLKYRRQLVAQFGFYFYCNKLRKTLTQINLNAIKLVYCCFSAPPLVRLKAAENKRFSPCHHFPYLARHSLARSRWSQIWLRERVVSAFTADGRQHHLLPLHSSALLLVPSVTSPPSAGSRGPVLHPQITWIHSLEPDLHRGTIFFLYHWAEGNSPAHKGCKHSPNSWFQASHMSLLMQLTFSCFHHFVCYTSSSFQVKNMFGTTFLCSKITFKTNNKCNFIISQSERTKYCRGKMKISFQVRG